MNKAFWYVSEYHFLSFYKQLLVKRGRSGFGFSMIRSGNVKVSEVEQGSHAQHSGLQVGDKVIRVNGHNVTKSSVDNVAKLIK